MKLCYESVSEMTFSTASRPSALDEEVIMRSDTPNFSDEAITLSCFRLSLLVSLSHFVRITLNGIE